MDRVGRTALTLPRPSGADLGYTGERFTGAAQGETVQQHWHRYLFALQLCVEKDVLDVACGEGYGSALLALQARRVIGVDIAPDAVAHAASNYHRNNLEYRLGNCTALPLPDAAVDVVVSFETLEHIAEHDAFLSEIRRVLRPEGLLVMSTPDRDVYSRPGSTPNPFHVRELNRVEFHALIGRYFVYAAHFAQMHSIGSAILVDATVAQSLALAAPQVFCRRGPETADAALGIAEGEYLVTVASGAEPPPIHPGMLDDRQLLSSLWQEIHSRDIALAQAHTEVAAVESRADALADDLEQARAAAAAIESRADALAGDLERTRIGRAASDAENARLGIELAQRDDELLNLQLKLRQRDAELRDVRCRPLLSMPTWSVRGARWARDCFSDVVHHVRYFAVGNQPSSLGEHVLGTGLFDGTWYLWRYPDVSAQGIDPVQHWLKHGVHEGRDPHPLFDTSFYLEQNPDVAANSIDPLTHYIEQGAAEGRDPNPLFDTSFYAQQNPDVAAAAVNPLAHFVSYGAAEGRWPNSLFDPRWYLETYQDVRTAGLNPLVHYLEQGAAEGRAPAPGFDPVSYAAMHPDAGGSAGALAHRLRALERLTQKSENS